MKILITICFCLILISTGKVKECLSTSGAENDKGIHNQLIVIKGKVTELNNLDLGVSRANSNFTLIFQKDECNSCLVATRPDIEGNYEIRVGRGKYRLIVTSPSPPEYDLLAPEQRRYVDTKEAVSQVFKFDVKLKLPLGK
jgi:hypothetical protein